MSAAVRCATAGRLRERGAVLFVALVVLVLMSLAAASVVRSMDTSNLIAGNLAFRQATMQASDRAITDALNNLANITAGVAGNTSVANRYSSTRYPPDQLDGRGVPTAINWGNVACVNEKGATVSNCDSQAGDYRIQYFIERQCDEDPDLTDVDDIKAKCSYEGTGETAISISLYYRVIIRARGPRGTEGWYEVMLSGPAKS
jgi:Tfp pilus assembly protein PilX